MAKFAIITNGRTVPINVVGNMSWGGQQSVVIYESPGTNAGTVLLTGRTTRKRVLNGRILRVADLDLADIKRFFDEIRDSGEVITLISPIDDGATDQYVITDFNGQVLEGIESYLPFTMELTEYRQANIKKARVNLIAFEPAERVRTLIEQRGITPT